MVGVGEMTITSTLRRIARASAKVRITVVIVHLLNVYEWSILVLIAVGDS